MKNIHKIIIIILVITVIVVLKLLDLDEILSFENLKHQRELLTEYVSGNYYTSSTIFILLYILLTGFSFPGASVLSLAGGLTFGTLIAAFYINIAATLGALIAFLIARHILGDWVQQKFSKQLARFNKELESNGYLYMLTLRLVPLFPFFAINLFAGLTRLPARTFIWTTSLGIIPGSLVYTYAGSRLNTIDSLDDIFSVEILTALVLLGLLVLVPVLYKKIKPHEK